MDDPEEGRSMRLCLLGCGWAAELHSRSLGHFRPQIRCSYASRSLARAQAFNSKYGGTGAFGSYAEALSSPSVDVVAVLTPPASHLEWALGAIEAGKDVILEKPPLLRSSDFDAVEQACRAHGRVAFVAENYYYKPVVSKLRAILAAGTIGDPLFIHLNAVKQQKISGWRDDPAAAGGGALFEGGIHWVNLAGSLGYTIRSVKAGRPGGGAGPERSMLLLIEYAEGPVATLAYSWETSSPLKGLRLSRIYGREGGVVFESNGLFLATSGHRWRLLFPGVRDLQGRKAMFADFFEAWRGRTEPQMTLARARRDLEVVEQAYQSAGVL